MCYLMAIVLVTFWLLGPPSGTLYAAEEKTKASKQETAKSKVAQEEEENRQKEAEEAKRLEELYLRSQNVFLRKGELMLEYSFLYSRNSQQELVPVTGGLAIFKVTRRFIDNVLTARYGLLTDGLELDLIAPVFLHGEQKVDSGLSSQTEKKDGFGDLSAALRYQLWYERGSRPSLVLDVAVKSRTGSGLTGTGTWNAGAGVTLIKSIDPVVVFGRFGYTYSFASQQRHLGDIFDYLLGMGFSLNDRVSFNVQLSGAFIGPGNVAGAVVDTTGLVTPVVISVRRIETMSLTFATTVLVTKKLFVEPFVAVPLTEESFTTIGFRIPYRF